MPMIKCTTCGKYVSAVGEKCPLCDNDLSKTVLCPKCGSADTAVSLRWGGFKYRILSVFILWKGHGINAWRHYEQCRDEDEYTARVRRVCNSCGKKFKVK